MASKKYNVTQKVNVGGTQKSIGFGFYGEASELSALLVLMEGGFSVTEENTELTNLAGAETPITAYNNVSKIGLAGKADDGSGLFTTIKPYKGSLVFKDTASLDDIRIAIENMKPWSYAPAVKVSRVSVSFSDATTSA